ncbi:MAG: DNA cytosine methyltransferase [Thermodesulfovibrionales bacterium]|nr:DNA cytosine methyltransferase [Thermodesulfovibrionales bacterium]
MLTTGHMCCGAGGDVLGASLAGAKPLWAFDLNFAAFKTAWANFPGIPFQADIRGFSPPCYVDVVVCGIPCQPFTRLGKRMKENDERDISVAVASAVRKVNPAWIIFENVTEYRKSQGFQILNSELSAYKINWQILNFADYGIPTTRRRLIGIASKDTLLEFPEPTHTSAHGLFDQKAPWEKFKHIRNGDGMKPVSSNILKGKFNRSRRYAEKGYGFSMQLIDDEDVMPTILGVFCNGSGSKSNAVFIYDKGALRHISFKEAYRAQGFPDEYIFLGTVAQKWQMVANALPPAMARVLIQHISRSSSC